MIPKAVPFTRPTIIAAVEFLGAKSGQAHFNNVVLRLGLENEITPDLGLAVAKKANALGRVVAQRHAEQVETIEGAMSLAEATIREAVQIACSEPVQETELAFIRGLARDGYVISFDEDARPRLRAALPDELGLPAVDDEVHQLLKHFAFREQLGHLDQGIGAHARGDWAAANAQFRTFLERTACSHGGSLRTVAADDLGRAAAIAFPGLHLGSMGRPSPLRWSTDRRRCTG